MVGSINCVAWGAGVINVKANCVCVIEPIKLVCVQAAWKARQPSVTTIARNHLPFFSFIFSSELKKSNPPTN